MYNLIWLRSVVKRFIDTRKPNLLLISLRPNLIQFIDTILTDLYTRINIDFEHRLNTDKAKNTVSITAGDVDYLYKAITIQISVIIRNMLKLVQISKTISQQLSFDSQELMAHFELLISSYRAAVSFLPSEFQLNSLPKFDVTPLFDIPKQTNLSLKISLPENASAATNDLKIQNTSGINIHSFPYPIIIQMIKEFGSDQSIRFVTDDDESIHLNMDTFQRLIGEEKLDYNAIRPYMLAIADALNGDEHTATSNSVNLVNEIYSRLLAYYVTGGTRVSPYRYFTNTITNESRIFHIIQLMQYGPLIVKNLN